MKALLRQAADARALTELIPHLLRLSLLNRALIAEVLRQAADALKTLIILRPYY
jgi:hypothetical protein